MTPEYKVRIERNVGIPMRDGKRLSADLIRPQEEGRYPLIAEYHPTVKMTSPAAPTMSTTTLPSGRSRTRDICCRWVGGFEKPTRVNSRDFRQEW